MVRRKVWSRPRRGAEVVLCALQGAGRAWPGGGQRTPQWLVEKTSPILDANAVLWELLKRHSLE